MKGVQGGEDDGHEVTKRWPGGARPSRWRRRASAGGKRLARPQADVGEAQAERCAEAAAGRGSGAGVAGARRHRSGAERLAVSYTHLRAHETKANLVCRLLLEK